MAWIFTTFLIVKVKQKYFAIFWTTSLMFSPTISKDDKRVEKHTESFDSSIFFKQSGLLFHFEVDRLIWNSWDVELLAVIGHILGRCRVAGDVLIN